MLLLYVDDPFLKGADGLIADTKRKLTTEFRMKDLGTMQYFLGMEVWQNVDGIFPGQGKYALEILKRFGMMGYKAMTTPISSNLKLLSDSSSEAIEATCFHLSHTWVMWQKSSSHSVCPWGKSRVKAVTLFLNLLFRLNS